MLYIAYSVNMVRLQIDRLQDNDMQIILTYPNNTTSCKQAALAVSALTDEYGNFDGSQTVTVKDNNLVTVLWATNALLEQQEVQSIAGTVKALLVD